MDFDSMVILKAMLISVEVGVCVALLIQKECLVLFLP
jgi:hypothetical protein